MARLSVLRDHSTPTRLVLSWYFFRTAYLSRTKKAVFYKSGLSESPDFHYDLVYDSGNYGRNVWGAPRGFAKSNVVGLEMPLLLALTKNNFDIALGLATDKLVEERFDKIIFQIQNNELIFEDFGNLTPPRGKSIFNHHHITLLNGSSIQGMSVMGKKRGGRPRHYILDDVENDPESDSETSRAKIIDKFETILFKQIIPMLESGSTISWIGTLIDRKSFLYRAIMGDDPRFDFWNRKVYKAMARDDSGKVYLLWPDKWPQPVLEAKKEEIGAAAYASEYDNEPVSPEDRLLNIDARKNEYSMDGEMNWDDPLNCPGIVRWEERLFDDGGHRFYQEQQRPFCDLVRPMFRALLFDYASGLTSYHDYSCIGIVGFDTMMTMWVLEMWMGRAKDPTLMRLIYEYALKWRVRVLGIEAVSVQKSFAEAVQDYEREQSAHLNSSWKPRILPVSYPSKESKAQRISSSLAWRFDSGRIKYPAHLSGDWPYDQLYAQTNDFTMDLALLQNDDAIDTLAQSKYVVKTRGRGPKRERGKPGLMERIVRNQPEAPGLPLLSGVPTSALTDEMINVLSEKRKTKSAEVRSRKLIRPPSMRRRP